MGQFEMPRKRASETEEKTQFRKQKLTDAKQFTDIQLAFAEFIP